MVHTNSVCSNEYLVETKRESPQVTINNERLTSVDTGSAFEGL